MATLRIAFALVMLLSVQSIANASDFYYFVVQWPGSYCSTQQGCCYKEKPTDFIIHSLVAANGDGTSPKCNALPFNQNLLSPIKPELNKQWPSLKCPNHDAPAYWAKIWKLYGSCISPKLDQLAYFQTSLNLNRRIDLLTALKNAGVKPEGGFYDKERLRKAMKRATGTQVGIECNVDKLNKDQLYQVYVCIDKTLNDFIDCPALPTWLSSTCTSNAIKFPAVEKGFASY